jgi:predicted transcriptional regulator
VLFLIETTEEIKVKQEKMKEKEVVSYRSNGKVARRNQRRLTWLPSLYFFAGSWCILTGSVMVLNEIFQDISLDIHSPRLKSALNIRINGLNVSTNLYA